MALLLALVVVLLAGLLAAAFRRHPDAKGRALALRRMALGLTAAYTALVGLFVAGEILADPGGWEGVGLVALWLVPLVVLGLLGWFRPDAARIPLTVATAAVVAVSIWYAIADRSWRSFENSHGPVRAIASFALCAALGAYGYRRPLRGGILLLAASLAPVVLQAAVGGGRGSASLLALTSPGAVTGVLYLASLAPGGGAPVPASGRDTPSGRPPPKDS